MSVPIFHIGLHKTGSTFLQQEFFQKNQDVFYVAERRRIQDAFIYYSELSYNPELAKKMVSDITEISNKEGKAAVFSEERLSGLPHEGGSDSLIIGRRIKEAAPNAKIILIIREQKSMIYSTYGQYIIGYGSCSLKEYLNPSTIKRAHLFNPVFLEYDRLIKFYQEEFGSENVLVLPFEMLKSDKIGFIDHIAAFIGNIDSKSIINRINLHPANSSQYDLYIYIKRYLNPFTLKGHKNLGKTLYFPPLAFLLDKFLKIIRRMNIRFINQKIKQSKIKIINAYTVGRYKESNVRTAQLINIDLKKYGYE